MRIRQDIEFTSRTKSKTKFLQSFISDNKWELTNKNKIYAQTSTRFNYFGISAKGSFDTKCLNSECIGVPEL